MMAIFTPTPPGQGGETAPAATPVGGQPPAPAGAVAATPQPGTYIVQPGDTLYGIAVRTKVPLQALMQANGISDPTTIQAGQVLVLPANASP
jgi:LysM repeat protein